MWRTYLESNYGFGGPQSRCSGANRACNTSRRPKAARRYRPGPSGPATALSPGESLEIRTAVAAVSQRSARETRSGFIGFRPYSRGLRQWLSPRKSSPRGLNLLSIAGNCVVLSNSGENNLALRPHAQRTIAMQDLLQYLGLDCGFHRSIGHPGQECGGPILKRRVLCRRRT